MVFSKWIMAVVIAVSLPLLVTAQDASTGINFDPAKNTIGSGQDKLTKPEGSVQAVTYLSGASDPVTISIRIVNTVLGFLGMISMILLLYAGIIWFKSGDNEEEIKRAKDIMKGALTGLVITLLAYGIAQLLFSQLQTATQV